MVVVVWMVQLLHTMWQGGPEEDQDMQQPCSSKRRQTLYRNILTEETLHIQSLFR